MGQWWLLSVSKSHTNSDLNQTTVRINTVAQSVRELAGSILDQLKLSIDQDNNEIDPSVASFKYNFVRSEAERMPYIVAYT